MTLNEFIQKFRTDSPILKGRCFYCGRQTNKEGKEHYSLYQTKDHVIPASVKGWEQYVESRMVICCRKCNSTKEDLTMQEFKILASLPVFFAEEHIGVKIEELSDIEEITIHIFNNRKIAGRCIKFNGKPQKRFRIILETPQPAPASNL